MKSIIRYILLLLPVFISSAVTAAKTGDANSLLTRTMLDDAGTSYVEKIDYYDGPGSDAVAIYRMMNGAKAVMLAPDVIKAEGGSGVLVSCGVTLRTGGVMQAGARSDLGYDGTGRVSTVTRGGNAGTVRRSRNIRGWTSAITGPGFSQSLSYTDIPGQELYSSLISRQTWSDGSARNHTYTYSYDDLGRLTDADYVQSSNISAASVTPMPVTKPANYGEHVTGYTPNGAITGIRRWGTVMSSAGYGLVDDLSLEYDGNRLKSVCDDAPNINVNGAVDFSDGADLDVEYLYNAEGALIYDANKGISSIEYDDCGYPRLVQFAGGSQTLYVYTPSGQKLREKHLTAVAGITVPQLQKIDLGAPMILTADSTDYAGPLVIRDGKVDMCLYEGGYFKATQSAAKWSVCYYTYDHLGNVRAVVDSDGNILQTLHYYPFGSVITELCKGYPAQPYQFGGKEFDRMHGLNWNDFGARRYDPALASWTSPDPLQKDYAPFSPYIYCNNNPVSFIDPNGSDWVSTTSDKGIQRWIWNDDVSSLEDAHKLGYSDYRPKGSIIDNARIGNGDYGSVYLGFSANDISYTTSNKDVTAWEIGTEWLSGRGPRDRVFHDGDDFAEMIRSHYHYQDVIQGAKISIRNGIFNGCNNYELSGIGGVVKYLKDYSTLITGGLIGNIAATYQGNHI